MPYLLKIHFLSVLNHILVWNLSAQLPPDSSGTGKSAAMLSFDRVPPLGFGIEYCGDHRLTRRERLSLHLLETVAHVLEDIKDARRVLALCRTFKFSGSCITFLQLIFATASRLFRWQKLLKHFPLSCCLYEVCTKTAAEICTTDYPSQAFSNATVETGHAQRSLISSKRSPYTYGGTAPHTRS